MEKQSTKKRIHYDCQKCLAYCCSIYDRVAVTNRDLTRLARHHNVSEAEAGKKYTKFYKEERILRRKKDPILGTSCMFLDLETRGCTIYNGRPTVCREYPDKSRCAYYDVLTFERTQQDDEDVRPLVQITFK